ncbi:chemotaxis protein CheA [Piscinibacter sakaiensis]|uniref:Chemotaxis protein CheA n=1 Tax=Piscinibacter sakaiensis TaxID=1547922 RepID=A0A0K8P0C1_PISS1|nr:chemotaxis protein CheA [Piscinibacter sakaiensis]GAP36081.1 signal transduction histidine kinase CheA [Piscinibacter sakaiensis]
MTSDDADFIAEALPAFVSEAREQLESFEQLLLQLEDLPGDRDLLDALFRCAHTVKGSAGIFGLDAVVAFTHHVESLLDRLREGELALTPALGTLLLRSKDHIATLVDAAEAPQSDSGDDAVGAGLVAELHQVLGDAAAAPEPSAGGESPSGGGGAGLPTAAPLAHWGLQARFGADTFRNGMDPLALLAYLGGFGQVTGMACDLAAVPPLEALDPEDCHLDLAFGFETAAPRERIEEAFAFVREDCALTLTAPAGAELAATPLPALPESQRVDTLPDAESAVAGERLRKPRDAEEPRFIRVQADRLDAVINLLGELVIAGAGAELLARQSRQGALIEANQHVIRLIEEIRNGTLQLRMVPIGEAFTRFRRVVRDTAAELGKDVALEIVGGDTELDKSVVERIADPLMHLVRNGLDHGLETPAERVAAGKPAQGRLVLSACHEAGNILIRIDDDGRGIDRERVLARAWERGLLEPGQRPEDADILKLIFEPGFSTAEQVTNLSGRGVGMDVVRRNIEALRGSVTLDSEPGRGTRIEIRLPLTLAIIDGFLVGVGSSRFIFPLDAVVEVIEARDEVAATDAHGRGLVELRGQVLPVIDLRVLYALEAPASARHSIVVVRAGTRRCGVRVDQVLGQHQTVIKPLGPLFRSLQGMAGSSILANGEVALIFDVPSLGQLAAAPRPAAGALRSSPAVAAASASSSRSAEGSVA